jgi:hypothetical protein
MMLTTAPDRRVAWRRIAIGLGLTALTLFGAAIYITLLYANTRPTSPRPELGRIYSLNTHGTVVYLTHVENLTQIGLFTVSVVLFVTGVICDWFFVRKRTSRRDSSVLDQ